MASLSGAQAVLLAARYCRQFPLFQWREEALPRVGRRQSKHVFRVDLADLRRERCGEMLLALLPEAAALLDLRREQQVYRLKALLVSLRHPYLVPVVDVYHAADRQGLLVVQPFVAAGSLKDRIHGADPARAYELKYRAASAAALPVHEVARFGRQVLQALAALRSKGILCDHLSAGNVLLDDGNARISDIYLPLLAVDRYKESRALTVPLEARVDVDLLLFGQVLYEMATGAELLTTQPDDSVLESLAPEIREVLEVIFFPADCERTQSEAPDSSLADIEGATDVNDDDDDAASMSNASTSGRRKSSSHRFLVDIASVEQCALFQNAVIPPIESIFAGFRLDSTMKSTIRSSMRINASRSHAHLVHYKDMVALERARLRAEHRVLEEKEKQQQRIQQLTESKNPLSKSSSFSSKTTPSRRQSYRADRFRAHSQRALSLSSSSRHGPTSTA